MNYFQKSEIGEIALFRELDNNAGDGSSGKQRQDTRRPFPQPDPALLRLRQLRGDLDDLSAYAALYRTPSTIEASLSARLVSRCDVVSFVWMYVDS